MGLPENKMIKERYKEACEKPSDINEHLPTLRTYADQCSHVTEFGVRDVVSTWAFLASSCRTVISYDINPCPVDDIPDMLPDGKVFQFRKEDVLSAIIEPTDMLFIDTLHTYRQLRAELAIHSTRVRKFIAMHDTITFGKVDEKPCNCQREGLQQAISEFLLSDAGKLWERNFFTDNNNGLTILRRK